MKHSGEDLFCGWTIFHQFLYERQPLDEGGLMKG